MSGLKSLKLNKGLETYRQSGCPGLKVTIPATVNNLSCDDYSLITIDKNNPYYEVYDGSLYDADKFLVTAADKPTLNIKEGDSRTRTLRYWNLHPDKIPSCIYVPFFELSDYKKDVDNARNKIRSLNEFFDFESTEGKAGYILHVTGRKRIFDDQ